MCKTLKILFLFMTLLVLVNCSDDNNCSEIMEVDYNDPESLRRAQDCGLVPAEPLGTIWVSQDYKTKHNLK
jgi:hypothetical protein